MEEYDALHVNSKLQQYLNAGRVHIALPEHITSYGAFVEIHLEIPTPQVTPASTGLCELISISIDWPPSQPGCTARRPINVVDYVIKRSDRPLRTGIIRYSDDKLSVLVEADELATNSDKICISLVTPSIYFLLPGIPPFQQYLLNLNIKVEHNIGSSILLFLDHPANISLRCRHDNSEYQSLAYSAQTHSIRKLTFFPQNELRIRYYYGMNDPAEYVRPAVPLFAGGLSLLSGAISLGLAASYPDIAATAFALLLLPPFIQFFAPKNILYPSSDISRSSIETLSTYFAFMLHIPLVVLTALAFISIERHGNFVMALDIAIGIFLVLLGTSYKYLVYQGVVHGYRCDKCETRIVIRTRAKLSLNSRKTLCSSCWQKEAVTAVVQSTTT